MHKIVLMIPIHDRNLIDKNIDENCFKLIHQDTITKIIECVKLITLVE